LSEDVEWEYSIVDAGVPWLVGRRGRGEVPKFFDALGGLDFRKFEPKTFLESGNIVVALIDLEVVVKANGRKVVEEDEVHIWHLDSAGQVVKFGHKVDTHQHWLAFRGE
jgi:hypothetical protein